MPRGLAEELEHLVNTEVAHLRTLSAEDVTAPRKPGAWSKIQILGHLIDSAANNHQRYVRAQKVDVLDFPGYDQRAWVEVQHYEQCDWGRLVDLWMAYNLHIAHVLRVMPDTQLDTVCKIVWEGETMMMPLREVVESYLDHARNHLAQLLG